MPLPHHVVDRLGAIVDPMNRAGDAVLSKRAFDEDKKIHIVVDEQNGGVIFFHG